MKIAIIALVAAFSATTTNAQMILGNHRPINGSLDGLIKFELDQKSVTFAPYSANSHAPSNDFSAINSSGDFFTQFLDYYYVEMRMYDPVLNNYIGHSTFSFGDFESLFSRGLAFDDNDQLYVLKCREDATSYWTNDAQLYKVDSQLGAQDYTPTLVGTLPVVLDSLSEITALDFHDGKLYSYMSPGGIIEIDPQTADFTFLTPLLQHVPLVDAAHCWFRGMCISDSGVIYLLGRWGAIIDKTKLFISDPETGAMCIVNEYSLPLDALPSIEFIEGATPPFALWQSGTTGNTPLGRFKVKGSGVNANEQVAVYFTTDLTAPPATIPAGLPGAGTQLNIGGTLHYLGTASADQNGEFKVPTGGVPASFRDKLLFQGVNLSNSKTTNFFRVIM